MVREDRRIAEDVLALLGKVCHSAQDPLSFGEVGGGGESFVPRVELLIIEPSVAMTMSCGPTSTFFSFPSWTIVMLRTVMSLSAWSPMSRSVTTVLKTNDTPRSVSHFWIGRTTES